MPEEDSKNEKVGLSRIGLAISILLLVGLIILVFSNFENLQKLLVLIEEAKWAWLFLAILLQLGTYTAVAIIWEGVIKPRGYKLSRRFLARLSVEKLTVNQLIPAVGVAGNVVVVRTVEKAGVPRRVALEALLIDTFSYYGAYAFVAIAAVLTLWFHHNLTHFLVILLTVFAATIVAIPFFLWRLISDKDWKVPKILQRSKNISTFLETVSSTSLERFKEKPFLLKVFALQVLIFLLDAGTLWAVLRAIYTPIKISTAFNALVVASIAGTVSFLPGGIGGFEAGATFMLTVLGTPVEAALAGTLLLRGLTLWLPLLPGLFFYHHDTKQ